MMAGSFLPLQVDAPITRAPQVSGSGQAADVQASAFGRVADAAAVIGKDLQRRGIEEAQRAGQADFAVAAPAAPDGEPVFLQKRKSLLGLPTVFDSAYNNMVEGLSLDRAKADASETIITLRGKHFGDVEGFSKELEAWRGGYLKNAPMELTGPMDALIQGQAREARQLVVADRTNADIKEARDAMDAGLESLLSETEVLLRDGVIAMDTPEVRERLAEINDRLDIKANNPLFQYSAEERALDADALADRMAIAALVPEVRRTFEQEGYAGALETADAMAATMNRDEAGTSRIRQRLREEANLMQQNANALQQAERARDLAEADARERLGASLDQAAVRSIYSPQATQEARLAAVNAAAPYITGSRYGELYSLAVKGPDGDDDAGGQDFARLMHLARQGQLSPDEAFEQGAGMSGSKMNQLQEEIAQRQNKDLAAGEEILNGAFAQGAFEFAPALAASEAEAKEELRRWRERSPDATALEITQQAREIAARRGRTAAIAVISDINARSADFTAPTPDAVDARMQEIEDALESGALEEGEAVRQYQQLQEVKRLLDLADGP